MGTYTRFLLNEVTDFTPEMEEWFNERTGHHIALVNKYAQVIHDSDPIKWADLPARVKQHDASKYQEPERTPYIFISWDYHMKDLGTPLQLDQETKDEMNQASKHHVKNNRHHPEFFDNTSKINREDRDKASNKMVDATAMSPIDIGEMAADWMGMSEERGNSPQEWADKTVNRRWKFTPEQVKLIYKLLDLYTNG